MFVTTLPLLALAAWSPADDVGGIHKAAGLDDPEEIKAALDSGANVNLPGPGGQTPLFRSVLAGREKAVHALLERGADLSIPESSGFTVMHGAAFRGRPALVKLLAEYGAPTNNLHTDGFAPIHRACWGDTEDDTATVKVLLELGVPADMKAAPDCRHEDLCKLSPKEMALKHSNEATAKLLDGWVKDGKTADTKKTKPKSPPMPPTPPTKAKSSPPRTSQPLPKAEKATKAPAGDLATRLAESEAQVASLTAQVAALQVEADRCEDSGLRCEALEVKVRQALKAYDAPPKRPKDEL